MNTTTKAAIVASILAVGGGSLLLADGSSVEVTAEQVADASIPAGAFQINDRDHQQHGWAKDSEASRKLLARAREFKGDPQRIDVFTAEACPSGLGYEVFTADASYASECLPEGIFPEPEDAGLPAEATDAAF